MNQELVRLEISRGVATVTLDSPANRNALSTSLLSGLESALDSAIADPSARLILLTHTGPVFCSGADLKEQRQGGAPGQGTGPGGLARVLKLIWQSPKPVIARAAGPARAGGIGLIAASDIAVAVETASFAFSEVRLGLIPAMISVVVIPKIGVTKAMELFLTGDTFDAKEAVKMGLLNAAPRAEDLDAVVQGYVASILKGSPAAVAGCKRLVREIPGMELDTALELTARWSAEFFNSEDAREGMAAFAEKRLPRWVQDA